MMTQPKAATPEVVFRGARLLDASASGATADRIGDVWVRDGRIHAIDRPGQIPTVTGAREIACSHAGSAWWLTPGLIDVHVHLREPGHEAKETIASGTAAAVRGGFAAVACMANTQPVNDSAAITAFIRERARASARCRVYPVGAVSRGLQGEVLAEIGGMVREGARALSDDGMPVMNSYLMRKAMDYARAFDVAVISHAEDRNLVGQGVMNEGALSAELGLRGNPAAAEEIMVAREIALCRLTRARVHIAHLSTREGLEHVRRAKDAGLPVTAEVSPHHLTLTEQSLRSYDTRYKMAPPLRTDADVEALHTALREGVIDVMATDHAPHTVNDKDVEFDHAAFGIIGLESALPLTLALVHRGVLSPLQWLYGWSVGPQRLLGLERSAASLAVGNPADLTLIDSTVRWTLAEDTLASKSGNSPFVGTELQGMARLTMVGGEIRHEQL